MRCSITNSIRLAAILSLSILSIANEARAAEPSLFEMEFFEKEVRPLLVEKCLECHGEEKPKSGLQLTSRAKLLKGGTRGPAIDLGKPDESLLLKAVRHSDDDLRMPPKEMLSAKQINVLARGSNLGCPGQRLPRRSRPRIAVSQSPRHNDSSGRFGRSIRSRRLLFKTSLGRNLPLIDSSWRGWKRSNLVRPLPPTSARFCAGRRSI